MKKINILKNNRDYSRIIKSNSPFHSKYYIIYLEKNRDSNYKFGFSIGKKIGNAVCRNKIKRQLKSIIDKKNYQNGFNCIIIVKKAILGTSYSEKEEALLEQFRKLNILEGATHEKKDL